MIIGKIHPGSGLGDQLFSYIATRVIALDKGYDFGFVGKEYFKGASFMNLDWGKDVDPDDVEYEVKYPEGEIRIKSLSLKQYPLDRHEFKFDKPYYDPEVNFIQDGTIIDGYGAQDERYWGHRLNEIKEWLKVEPLAIKDDLGVINLRGGEYRAVSDLILPESYWEDGILQFPVEKEMNFEIHTDDLNYSKELFGKRYNTYKDISLNWRSLRYAKNAIISNSAFAIIPRLLKHLEDPEAITIAPRYWAGRNVGEWRRPQNYYKKFTYI